MKGFNFNMKYLILFIELQPHLALVYQTGRAGELDVWLLAQGRYFQLFHR
jgi:hypothetical protein